MKLKVKDVDIATGGIIVAILNEDDAKHLDLHYEDRVRISKGRKHVIAIIDISESKNFIPDGSIGLMEEALKGLGVKNGDFVKLGLEKTPDSVGYIIKKLDGIELKPHEINSIVKDIVDNRLSRIEKTYFVSGCYVNGLSTKETVNLIKAMVKNGEQLKIGRRPIVDKHCIGGVAGNRTTMIIVPIIAAAGLTIPKTSSRSITSPSGTADTMEVLANVSIPISKMKKVVERTNGCITWGGAFNLAAADDKLIRLRHPLSLDPVGMVLASVLAKKKSVNATHVLIDIPVGKGAKIEDRKTAQRFKRLFEVLGKELGMNVKVILTDGSQPIGNGIGPMLEARDVLWILDNDKRGSADLRKKSVALAGIILEMVGKAKKGEGKRLANYILKSGMANNTMKEIIKAQGAYKPSFKIAKYKFNVKSPRAGKVRHIDNKIISKIAKVAGAPLDCKAGVFLYKHKNDKVAKNEELYTIYAENSQKLKFAKSVASKNNGFKIR